jgi:hypothetical protein
VPAVLEISCAFPLCVLVIVITSTRSQTLEADLTMRSSTLLMLFATSSAAQSIVTLFNFFPYQSTLTQIGSDAIATTYKNDCAANKTGFSLLPSSLRKSSQSAPFNSWTEASSQVPLQSAPRQPSHLHPRLEPVSCAKPAHPRTIPS